MTSQGSTAPARPTAGAAVVWGHRLDGARLVVAVVLLGGAVAVAATTSAGWWVVLAGAVGPDLAFLAALGSRPDRPGQMPPRVVPVYNATHSLLGPWLLAVASALLVSAPLAAGALAWHAHLQWDRGVGYGLRSRDGDVVPPRRWVLVRPRGPAAA